MTKSIVVTGAGTGIGLAIAKSLAESGYSLILLGRDSSRLHSARQTLNHPDWHQVFACDVRKNEDLRSALSKSQVPSLHAVVVNAGVGGENQAGGGDRWQEIIDTNLTGSYHTVRECLPYLKKNPDGFRQNCIHFFHTGTPRCARILRLLCFQSWDSGIDAVAGQRVEPR